MAKFSYTEKELHPSKRKCPWRKGKNQVQSKSLLIVALGISNKYCNTEEVCCREEEEVRRNNLVTIAFHNINGIKSDNTKLESLLDFAEGKKIDIVGLCETNIQEKESQWLIKKEEKYRGFWASAEEEKKKRSGVALFVYKRVENYLARVFRWSSYLIEANLVFKNETWYLFVVYIPPNDQEVEKELCKKLVSRIEQVQCSDKAKVLIMGDFNTEASNTLLNGKKAQAGLNRRSLLQKIADKGFKNTH